MKKVKTSSQTLAPRWIPLSVIGAVLVFVGFAGYQMVSAQTSAFTNPSCDPTTSSNCNKPAPLFLSPTDRTITQVVETPVSIGNRGTCSNDSTKFCNVNADCGTGPTCNTNTNAEKDIALFGSLTLSAATDVTKKIQTAANYSGQAINVESTLNHAIYGASGGNLMAGIYGIAKSANSYGVSASSGGTTAIAINADAGANGIAAQLTGPVVYKKGNNTATLTVDDLGNLNISTLTSGTANGKGLTVNGLPAAGSLKGITVPGVGAQNAITAYDVATNVLGVGKKYPVTSLSVMYRNPGGATPDYWMPIATTSVNYRECNGIDFVGSLELTNPVATPQYRVYIGYDATTTVICSGSDTTPPAIGSISGLVNNGWYGGTITITGSATENSGVGLTSMSFYDSVGGGAPTLIGTTPCSDASCVNNNKTLTLSWSAGGATSSYPSGTPTHSLTITATSAGGTSVASDPLVIKTFTAADSRKACSGNIITCATAEFCCGSSTINNGVAYPNCKETSVIPYTCTANSGRCGQCSGTGI